MGGPGTMEIAMPDILSLQGAKDDVLAAADSFEVKTDEDLARGSGIIKLIKDLRSQIKNTFDGPIKMASDTHKSFLEAKRGHDAPLAKREGMVKQKVADFIDEANRKAEAARKAEEDRIRKEQEEEQKRKEEEALAAAEEAEVAGDQDKAEEILTKVEEAPPPLPPVPVRRAIPKVEGMRATKTWSAKLVSLKELAKAVGEGRAPLDCVQPNMVMLNSIARGAKKEDLGVPGVIGLPKTGVASR